MDKSLLSLHVVSPALLAGALLVLPAASLAQAPPSSALQPAAARRVTLDEALHMAEAGSETVAAAEAGVRRADGQIALARSTLYPPVAARAVEAARNEVVRLESEVASAQLAVDGARVAG